jgi:hypothetical protein
MKDLDELPFEPDCGRNDCFYYELLDVASCRKWLERQRSGQAWVESALFDNPPALSAFGYGTIGAAMETDLASEQPKAGLEARLAADCERRCESLRRALEPEENDLDKRRAAARQRWAVQYQSEDDQE